MRIAYVCGDRGVPVGGTKGASIHVRGVVTALAARGHDVRIVAARSDPSAQALPASVIDVGFDRVLKDLQGSMIQGGADAILASETYNLLLNVRLHRALVELDRLSRIDAIYERYSLWSWAGLHFARERGVPLVLEVNAPLVDEQRRYRTLSLLPVARGLERQVLSAADAIVVPSAALRAYVLQRAGRRSRVRVIPNGVDLDLFGSAAIRTADREARRDGRFVVAFLGSLKPWHGIRHLLRAFRLVRRSVPGAQLLVIGEGPMLPEIERADRRLGADAIALCGAVRHEDVPGHLARADVGVAPYPDLAGFYFSPLKIVEYLAAGLPVVASGIGQILDLVRHERTGLIVPPGDAQALAGALTRLHGDRRLRARLGRRARERAVKRHGWSRVAEEIETILEDRVQGGRGRARSGRSAGTRPPALAGTIR